MVQFDVNTQSNTFKDALFSSAAGAGARGLSVAVEYDFALGKKKYLSDMTAIDM